MMKVLYQRHQAPKTTFYGIAGGISSLYKKQNQQIYFTTNKCLHSWNNICVIKRLFLRSYSLLYKKNSHPKKFGSGSGSPTASTTRVFTFSNLKKWWQCKLKIQICIKSKSVFCWKQFFFSGKREDVAG